VEVVNIRATVVGRMPRPVPRERGSGVTAAAARKGTRRVFFGAAARTGASTAGDFVDCPIYDRYQLAGGISLDGPAIVEELDSTTVVLPGFAAVVDRFGNLLIGAKGA